MASARKRCAVYTRKSSEEGLEQSFNSLDAQREACAAYIASQRHEGWHALPTSYDDGGYSGGSMERPALQRLLNDISAGAIDVVVVYKVDRLTRALSDFAKMVELFDSQGVSFVSVTQQFNTTTSMGRLTLNVLLSFAQFEREVTGERIRDKIAASKKKGMWMGGHVPLGYDLDNRKLLPNAREAELVCRIYQRYLDLGCVRKLHLELKANKILSKMRTGPNGRKTGGVPYSRGALYAILQNRLYLGEIAHRGSVHEGQQEALVARDLWDKVQERLRSNGSARRLGTNAKAPSLLAGLLYDKDGHCLTPLHSTKNLKRYRYYTSQRVIRNGPAASDEPLRVPAHEIEQLVLDRLLAALRSPSAILAAAYAQSAPAAVQRTLITVAGRASSKLERASTEAREFLLAVLRKIEVSRDRVVLHVDSAALRRTLGVKHMTAAGSPEGDLADTRLEIEAHFRRLSGAVRLIVPNTSPAKDSTVNEPLLKALARARRWYEMLESGEMPSIHALSRATGLHERYVGRVLRCAFLAPDIVAAVIEGRQPQHLTLDALMKQIPVRWREQRKRFCEVA